MQNNTRLYPSKNNSRFYILTQLRTKIEEVIQKYISPIQKEKQLLDYGCGTMPYKELYLPFVSKYIGADFSDNALADIFFDENNILPLPETTISIIVSTQVLEHVANVNLYLQECHRLLKEDGLLILSTHGFWKYHPHPQDYWRWTKAGLEKILIDNQFEPIETIQILGLGASGLQLFQDSLLSFLSQKWHKYIIYFIRQLQVWVDKRDKNLEDACVFLVVAKKKKYE